jgi:flagellar M-ring protein FliF
VQQVGSVWAGLDRGKQIVVILAAIAVVAAFVTLSRMVSAPSMSLLYAGLENGAAGDVVRALDQRGMQYEVRGGSIYVPSSQRDELRMMLASEGLPSTGGRGYELLDSLSGFGTTSQMFDAAYWRAKEGELARTIVASPHISQARVHIANTGSSPFQRSVQPSASVSIVPSGVPLNVGQANALKFLVASAVAGLTVDNVAVIDANGALIGAQEDGSGASTADEKSTALRERVLRLVEARVGPGNAVVEVSVDTVTETESIRKTEFDPEGRVAISTDTEERSDTSKNQGSGDVTVASNIPDGDGAAGEESSAQASETRERVNYEVSQTEHEILRAPGAIRRLTVAVLVNGLQVPGENGATVFEPRPEEEIAALQELVQSAVGFQEDRGDVITIKSMELPSVSPQGTQAESSLLAGLALDIMTLLQAAMLAVVALILGLFVIRPILANGDPLPPGLPAPTGDDGAGEPALNGEIDDVGSGEFLPMGGFPAMDDAGGGLPSLPSMDDSDPVDKLREMIGERQEETVGILRSWLEEETEKV